MTKEGNIILGQMNYPLEQGDGMMMQKYICQ